jgi:predicted RNA-binding Zn ribbon-like protein
MKGTYNLPAPGDLELVRQFLNTWLIPSATGIPEDHLPALLQDPVAWRRTFPDLPPAAGDGEGVLTALRDDLRGMLGAENAWTAELNHWLARFPPTTRVMTSDDDAIVRHVSAPETGVAGWILAAVVNAIADGVWPRLKICPDCRWVFYDRTRSRTKIWCDMLSGGAGGRSCGTIAKVRRYRARQAS